MSLWIYHITWWHNGQVKWPRWLTSGKQGSLVRERVPGKSCTNSDRVINPSGHLSLLATGPLHRICYSCTRFMRQLILSRLKRHLVALRCCTSRTWHKNPSSLAGVDTSTALPKGKKTQFNNEVWELKLQSSRTQSGRCYYCSWSREFIQLVYKHQQ